MKSSIFLKKLETKWLEDKFVCVGLDSDLKRIPRSIKGKPGERILNFNKKIIDSTSDLVLAYKPNSAFYEAQGPEGIQALKKTVEYIHNKDSGILVILDAKRGDIGSTNEGYVKFAFDYLDSDAITLHPYLGKESLMPFLKMKNKGNIILVKTSNPGSSEIQNLDSNGKPLFLKLVRNIVNDWDEFRNVAIVAGATYPNELSMIRKAAPLIPILIPGIGAQGGNTKKTIKAGRDKNNKGIIVNSSRDIIFASSEKDFADVARKKVQELNKQIISAMQK